MLLFHRVAALPRQDTFPIVKNDFSNFIKTITGCQYSVDIYSYYYEVG